MLLGNLKKWVSAGLVALALATVISTPARAEDERKVKQRVAPIYPELAKRMNVTGSVKVQVVVLPNGTVKSAKIIGGHPLLVDPAIDAAKKWKFEPANEETTNTVEFKFDKDNN